MSNQAGPFLLTALVLALGLPLAEGAAEHVAPQRSLAPGPTPGVPLGQGEAVRTGNTLYIAARVGIDPRTGNIPPERAREARLVMEGLKQSIARAGLQMDDLVSVTVFSTDLTLNEAFNAVYQDYFRDHYPVRAVVGASTLARGAHFEVTAIAVKPPHLLL